MNRTPLSHRVAVLAAVAVLACGWLQTADAQNMPPASPPQPKVFKAYHLRYVHPGFAASALNELMDDGERMSIRISAGANGTLLMSAPPEAYKQIDEVIKAIDVPPAAEPETQIKVFSLMYAEPNSVATALGLLLPKDTRRAVNDRTRSVIISGSRGALDIAEAVGAQT